MKIGELATATETAIETIRFYEREGLLKAAARSQGNFRLYEIAHHERLQFIRYCRSLDMSLDEIRVLLGSRMSLRKLATRSMRCLRSTSSTSPNASRS